MAEQRGGCKLPKQCNTVKKHSKLLKCIFFLVKELLDCVFDWCLVNELLQREEGLVFGRINNSILGSVIFFSCVGTVFSVIDIINRLFDLRTGSPFINIGITEFCVVCFEDIPQLSIGIIIVNCKDDTLTVFTFARAVILFCAPGYTLFLFLDEYGNKRTHGFGQWFTTKDRDGKQCLKERFVLCFGVVILSLLTIITTFSPLGKHKDSYEKRIQECESSLSYRQDRCNVEELRLYRDISDTPRNKSQKERYLFKVGIYADAADLQYPVSSVRWFKFFDVHDILKHGEITTRVMADMNSVRIQNFHTRSLQQRTASDMCYYAHRTNDEYFTKSSNCAMVNETTFHYHFTYISPSQRHVLGDIWFNVLKAHMNSCHPIASTRIPKVRYFRAKASINAAGHLSDHLVKNKSKYKFYSADDELVDIIKFWRVESWACDITKSDSPHLKQKIAVPCGL